MLFLGWNVGLASDVFLLTQLINKGIIYSVKYKELDFTVPEFDGFIKRLEEYQEWMKECE